LERLLLIDATSIHIEAVVITQTEISVLKDECAYFVPRNDRTPDAVELRDFLERNARLYDPFTFTKYLHALTPMAK
jgi:hypothetical protein